MSTPFDESEIEAEISRLISGGVGRDDLLMILGEHDGARFAAPTDKKNRGLRFLRNAVDRVRDQLCTNEFLHAHGQDPSTQRTALAVAATLDFMGAKGAATAAVLIAQAGLENVCAGRWERHGG